MASNPHAQAVRNPAELGVGDQVLTPSQRRAEVVGHRSGRVALVYLDDSGRRLTYDTVMLFAHCLRLVRRAGQPAVAPVSVQGAAI